MRDRTSDVASAKGLRSFAASQRWGVAIGRLALALPLAFALPVAAGVVVSVIHLAGTAHPGAGWSNVTNASTAASYSGARLYQDPAAGFTGGIFPPLLPWAGSALDHVTFWSGWVILLTILASVAMATRLSVLAYAPQGTARLDQLAAIAGAVGIGALTWWLTSSLSYDFLLDGRVDQPAWVFAILGLLLVPDAVSGSNRAWMGALVLITASVWTKQTSLTAVLATGAWLPIACVAHVGRWARAAWLMLALIVLNAAIFVLGDVSTDGWLRFFLIDVARDQAITASKGAVWHEFSRSMILPGAIVAIIALAGGAALIMGLRRAEDIRSLRRVAAAIRSDERVMRDVALATLMVVFIAIAAVGALYARRKQGTTDNQYIGIVWGLGVLAALAYRYAVTRWAGAAVVALLSVLLLGLTQADALTQRLARRGITVPPLTHVERWNDVDPAIRAFVRTHDVYWGLVPDVNAWAGVAQDPARRRRIYPAYFDVLDLLAGGRQPLYLADALLNREFDAVQALPDDPGYEAYASAYGKWEENYIWKLNTIIESRYAASPTAPAGFLVRRRGPEPARWMRTCFGPFRFPGGKLEIGRGGGLWCQLRPRSYRITLRDTPAPVSELRARDPIDHLAGTLKVELPAERATFNINVRRPDLSQITLIGERHGKHVVLSQFDAGRKLGELTVRRTSRQSVRVLLSSGPPAAPNSSGIGSRDDVVVRFGDVHGGAINLSATRRSDVTFDVQSLDLG
jgi:hypothetical protein